MSAPLDALWQAPALVWVLIVGEGLAIVLALAAGIEGSRWVAFGLYSLMVQWASLITLGIVYALRRALRKLPPSATALLVMGIVLLSALGVGLASWSFARGGLASEDGALHDFLLRTGIIALTAGLLGLAAFQNYWLSRRAAIRAKQAELEALQARVHPHFLFNTLNSAATLLHARPDDAERVLLGLSDLFRAALSEPGWVPLEHELDLCRQYLAIEQQRFGERLQVEWSIGDGLAGTCVPLLAIQPLVENAVAHGLDQQRGRNTLQICASQSGGDLVIEVRNPTAQAPAARRSGRQVGLAAVRARIDAATGGLGDLRAQQEEAVFVARVALPMASMPQLPA